MSKIYSPLVPEVEIPENTPIFDFILEKAKEYPAEKAAMVDYNSGFTITYGELPKFIFTAAKNFQDSFGLKKGDVVAFLLPNHPLFPILFHGVNKAGGIVTPINPLYKPDEIRQQLLDSKACKMVTVTNFADNVLKGIEGTDVKEVFFLRPKEEMTSELPSTTVEGVKMFDALSTLMKPPTNTDFTPVEFNCKEDVAAMPYSSGTTGTSKGVMLTHHNLVSNCLQIQHLERFTPEDVLVAILPMFHIYGFLLLNLRALIDGTTTYFVPRFDFVQFLTLIQEKKLTRAHLVPPILLAMAKHPVVDKFDLSSLTGVLSGAAPLSREITEQLVTRMRKHNPNFVARQGYGLTESSPVLAASFPDKVVYGSCGVLISNTQMRVVDPVTEKDLDYDEEGELVFKGPQIMKGYLNNEEATKKTVRDGWLFTGDVGKIDRDGNIYITDRMKDIIKIKGHQASGCELEGVLLTHDAIADCAVIGVPDEEAGELPKAFIVLKEGQTVKEEEIIQFMRDRVAPHKRIHYVEYIKEVPKSASGKILRRKLREM